MDGRRRGTGPAFRHGRRFSRSSKRLAALIMTLACLRETARLDPRIAEATVEPGHRPKTPDPSPMAARRCPGTSHDGATARLSPQTAPQAVIEAPCRSPS